MISKTHTIEAIMDLNPSANPGFLAEFAQDELARYLFRLADVTPMSRASDVAVLFVTELTKSVSMGILCLLLIDGLALKSSVVS
ncbi:MAG: hypothetical protein IH897_08985 [Planctomycetes bacterium]|nr:hypothetical protein [Planctomycetota bacterium]